MNKIAIINPWNINENSIGGTERFVLDLANSLSKNNYAIDVYMLSGESYIKDNVSYISLDLFDGATADEYMIVEKFGDFSSDKAYDNIAKMIENKIDVSQYKFLQLNSHFFLKCWETKKRIFTLHSNYDEFKVLWNDEEFDTMLEMMKATNDDKTTFVCPSVYYTKQWNKIVENVICIPHALNYNRLVCSNPKKELISKYNILDEKINILLPSRLEPVQKQPQLVLDACSLLTRKEKEKLRIIFTGIDEQYKINIKSLDEFSRINNITSSFIQFDHIKEGYQLADIVILPSKSESFGYSAIEALSLGIKTILSDIPTFNEISKGVEHCIIFGNSAEELSNTISKCLDYNDYQRTIPSVDWINNYSLDKFAERYVEIYE